MGIVADAISWVAKTKPVSKFYKWASKEENIAKINKATPLIESTFATACYVAATERQKNLDRREKNVLQYQNIIPAIVGISISAYLNKVVTNFGDKIIKHLEPDKIKDVHKIIGAIRVLLPITITVSMLRFASPVLAAYLSGEIEEYRAKKNKLDIKA